MPPIISKLYTNGCYTLTVVNPKPSSPPTSEDGHNWILTRNSSPQRIVRKGYATNYHDAYSQGIDLMIELTEAQG